MSDIEDLADMTGLDIVPPEGARSKPQRVASGHRLQKIQRDTAVVARRNPDRLRLSSAQPSLPRLKFLEGSDE